mgnify:CR=1 FL=1
MIANETFLISRSELNDTEQNQKKFVVNNYKEDLIEIIDNLQLEDSNLSVVNFSGSLILKPLHIMKEDEFIETLEINLLTNFRALSKILKINLNTLSYVALSSVAASYGLFRINIMKLLMN